MRTRAFPLLPNRKILAIFAKSIHIEPTGVRNLFVEATEGEGCHGVTRISRNSQSFLLPRLPTFRQPKTYAPFPQSHHSFRRGFAWSFFMRAFTLLPLVACTPTTPASWFPKKIISHMLKRSWRVFDHGLNFSVTSALYPFSRRNFSDLCVGEGI